MSPNPRITPVILSGGCGSRLWPLSTPEKPKQFLELLGPKSMFQLTLERCADQSLFQPPIIVGSSGHSPIMKDQMTAIGTSAGSIILEPCPRNTAPAIALAALAAENPTDLLLVMPSDHIITNVTAFEKAVQVSIPVAQSRWLVTFGIEPTQPATGYGYIQQGKPIVGTTRSFSAEKFVEKPDRANAEKMIDQGGYHWNAGIFLFRADTYLEAMNEFAPEMLVACQSAMAGMITDKELCYPDADAFASAPSDSIDYAIMERADKVAVTPVSPGWSDVGSWDSLFDICNKDENSNVIFGKAETLDSKNNLIHSRELEIAVLGMEDVIIVTHENKVMVLPRGHSEDVKAMAKKLKGKG